MLMRETLSGILFVIGLCAVVIGSFSTLGAILFIILDNITFFTVQGKTPASLLVTCGVSFGTALVGALCLLLSSRYMGNRTRRQWW